MASLGAVIVGLGTSPSSIDFVPVQRAAFIFSLGWGLYSVVYTGLCAHVRLVIDMQFKTVDLLLYFCHYRVLMFFRRLIEEIVVF